MQSLKQIDFARRPLRITPTVCALFAGALIALVWIGVDIVRANALGDEVVSLQERVDARQRLAERARRDEMTRAPEERKVDAVMSAQVAAKAKGAVPLLAKIGMAWKPQIALLGVSVQHAGREAKITGEARDLGEVYSFVDRLQACPGGLRAMLLRHGAKDGDSRGLIAFDVSVEQP